MGNLSQDRLGTFTSRDGKRFPAGREMFPSMDGKHLPVGMANISRKGNISQLGWQTFPSGDGKRFPVGMGNVSSDGKSSSIGMGNIFHSQAVMGKFSVLPMLVGWFLCIPSKFLANQGTRKLGLLSQN